jgi:preprotein translocase subunit SecG
MLFYVGITVYVLVCFLLLGVVLLQQGKGGDIAAAFGGSSSQTAFGARAGATVLTRATAILGSLFMVGAFLLTAAGRSAPGGSVVSGVEGPAQSAPELPTGAPLPPPTTTTPPAGGGSGSGAGSEAPSSSGGSGS